MKVVVKLFAPPGRGEFYERVFDMLDANRPVDMEECIKRSKAAIRKCWPTANVSAPTSYTAVGKDEQYVEAGNWNVSWLPDDYKARAKQLLDAISDMTFAELQGFSAQRRGMYAITDLRSAA